MAAIGPWAKAEPDGIASQRADCGGRLILAVSTRRVAGLKRDPEPPAAAFTVTRFPLGLPSFWAFEAALNRSLRAFLGLVLIIPPSRIAGRPSL